MPIHVIQNGIDRPPDEAWNCPHCGTKAAGYKDFNRMFQPEWMQMQCTSMTPYIQQAVPTFSCEKCGCIWQYEKEMPQPESEADKQEGEELEAKIDNIQAGDGIKPDDGKIEAAEDKCPWYKKLWDIFTFRRSRW